jgi:hypothetical protein
MTHRRVHSRRASMASLVASRRARRARIEKVFLHAFHRVRPRWHPRDGSHDVDDRSIPRIHLFDSRPFDSLALLADTACDMNRHARQSSYFLPSIADLVFIFIKNKKTYFGH